MLAKHLMPSGRPAVGEKTLVVSGFDDFVLVDVTDPTNMSLVGGTYSLGDNTNSRLLGYDATNAVLYTGDPTGDNLYSWDVSDWDNVTQLDKLTSATYYDDPRYIQYDPVQDVILVAGDGKLTSVDVSDPSAMVRSDTELLGGSFFDGSFYPTDQVVIASTFTTIREADYSTASAITYSSTSLGFGAMSSSTFSLLSPDGATIIRAQSSAGRMDVRNRSSSYALLDSFIDSTLDDPIGMVVDWDDEVVIVLTDLGYVVTVDISDLTNLAILDSIYNADLVGAFSTMGVEIDTEAKVVFMKFPNTPYTLWAYDYSDPTTLSLAGSVTGTASTFAGGYAMLKLWS